MGRRLGSNSQYIIRLIRIIIDQGGLSEDLSNTVMFPVQSAEFSLVPFLPPSIPFSIDWEEETDR